MGCHSYGYGRSRNTRLAAWDGHMLYASKTTACQAGCIMAVLLSLHRARQEVKLLLVVALASDIAPLCVPQPSGAATQTLVVHP